MALMFAATYPKRTSALVMFGTFASMKAEPYCLSQGAIRSIHWRIGRALGRGRPGRHQCAEPEGGQSLRSAVWPAGARLGESGGNSRFDASRL